MTLTETATITKRFLRVFLIFGSAFIVLWIAFLVVYNNYIIPYQRSQIKPEKKFGALPQPKLPATLLSSAALSYSLDTPSGNLPTTIPRLIKVYFLPSLETSLLSPDRARQLTSVLGFKVGPEILSPTNYRFRDSTGGTINIDLSTSNFEFKRTFAPLPSSPQDEFLPTDDVIIKNFENYLSQNGLLQQGFTAPFGKVIYDKGTNKDSSSALVSLWPDAIDKYPIMTENPDVGLINASVTKYQETNLRYPSLNYTYWPVDKLTFSTYSVEPVANAFKQLQSGGGVVTKKNGSGTQASITKVYLAYYESKEYSSFLEPVFVFEGDQFSAYVPALSADSYSQ